MRLHRKKARATGSRRPSKAMTRLPGDITRQRDMFEGLPVASFSHDASGRIQDWNAACETIYGIPAAQALQLAFWELFTGPEQQEQARQLSVSVLTGQSHEGVERVHSHPDGARRRLLCSHSPLLAPGGVILGAVTTTIDVTARAERERESAQLLSDMERRLEDALERADRDPLTGLWNHQAFHDRLEDEADRALRGGTSLTIAVLDLDNFKFFNDAYGHIVGDGVLRQVATALRASCRSYDTLARYGGDEFALLFPGAGSECSREIVNRLRACTQHLGFQPDGADSMIPLHLSVGLSVFPDDGPGRLDALNTADTRLLRSKSGARKNPDAEVLRALFAQTVEGFALLDALVAAVDNKDRYTRRHSEDVMFYSRQIAGEMGMDGEALRVISLATLLHDVGKIGVPESILRKPSGLTTPENRAIQQHPTMGAMIVASVPGFEAVLEIVRHHHERWDGAGYPGGLSGAETPLLARLVAVADAYSAMTTDRPYRRGMDPDHALDILEDGSGIQWDPRCVEAFLRARRGAVPATVSAS